MRFWHTMTNTAMPLSRNLIVLSLIYNIGTNLLSEMQCIVKLSLLCTDLSDFHSSMQYFEYNDNIDVDGGAGSIPIPSLYRKY